MIDWDVIQVEPKGEFQTDPLCILDKKVTLLWNRAIIQVKMQWKHFGLDEATWELEDSMKEEYPFFSYFEQTPRTMLLQGGGDCNTPNFDLECI